MKWVIFILFQIYNKRMETSDRNSFQYEISLCTFKEEATHKQMLLQKLSYQMSLKASANSSKKKQATCEMVQLCRKNMEEIQGIFGDIHSYFVDLKLEFIYDLILKIFKNLVQSFKILSERFIIALKDKRNNDSQAQENNLRRTQKLIEQIKNKNFSELQYFDSLIKAIEIDEFKLAEKKRQAEKKMMLDKTLIENINASDAVNQLETLKKQMDRIVMNSLRLGGEDSVIFQETEELKQLKALKKPDQIQEQYCTKITENTQQLFIQKMHQITRKLYLQLKNKEKESILKQINDQKPVKVQKQVQACQIDYKHKMQQAKDKSSLIVENQLLKRTNFNLRKEIHELSGEKEIMEEEYKNLQDKIKYTSELLQKKASQLSMVKSQFQYNIHKKDETIQALNKKIVEIQIKSQKVVQQIKPHFETATKDDADNESFFMDEGQNLQDSASLKLKSQASRTQRTSFFYQRQFKVTKQQNSHLRKSLSIMLDALQEQRLILDYPISDLTNDLRLGKLIAKIEAIAVQFLHRVNILRLEEQKLKQKAAQGKQNIRKSGTIQQQQIGESSTKCKDLVSVQTQTLENYYFETIYAKQPDIGVQSVPRLTQTAKKPIDKIQMLKKQLIDKVHLGRRNYGSVGKPKQYLNEIDSNRRNKNNASLQTTKNTEQQSRFRRISKTRPTFNRKDISFQQFKFSMIENKSQYAQKKILNRIKKTNDNLKASQKRRINNKSHQIHQIYEEPCEQKQQDELVFGVHGYECMSEVKKVVQLIQSKNQNKDKYARYFINKLAEQLRKVNGSRALQQLLQGHSSKFELGKQNYNRPLLSCQ